MDCHKRMSEYIRAERMSDRRESMPNRMSQYIYMCVCAKYTVRVPNILPNDMSETMAQQWIRVIITQSKVIKVSKLILGTSFSPNTKDPLKIKITHRSCYLGRGGGGRLILGGRDCTHFCRAPAFCCRPIRTKKSWKNAKKIVSPIKRYQTIWRFPENWISLNHPFEWDFPWKTIHFGYHHIQETSIYQCYARPWHQRVYPLVI